MSTNFPILFNAIARAGFVLPLAVAALFSSSAEAALINAGNGLINQSGVYTLTWLADANSFKTFADSNAGLVAEIKTAVPIVSDASSRGGKHTVVDSDFDPETGDLNYFGAKAWVAYLNSISYKGYQDWQLPTTVPAAQGYGLSGSQLGNLFYNDLGGVVKESIVATHNTNYALFTNVQNAAYWSGTSSPVNSILAFAFYYNDGLLSPNNKTAGRNYAWAVRPGNAAVVPIPGAFWLMGSAVAGLTGFGRRKKIAA